jgi:hypothetical protein
MTKIRGGTRSETVYRCDYCGKVTRPRKTFHTHIIIGGTDSEQGNDFCCIEHGKAFWRDSGYYVVIFGGAELE